MDGASRPDAYDSNVRRGSVMEIVKRKETERSAGGAEDDELDGGLAARSRTMTTSHADASVVQMWKQNDASASDACPTCPALPPTYRSS